MRRWLTLFVASALGAACNDPDHPARLGCPPEQAPCGPTNPPPVGGYEPSKDAGAGNDASVPDGGVQLSGRVAVLSDAFEPTQTVPLTEPARVQIESQGGSLVEASVVAGGYSLAGVRLGPIVWAAVLPDASTDLMPTLQPLDTRAVLEDAGASADLLAIRPSSLDLVLSVLTLPVERVPGAAHAVLRFVDEDGAPVEGVTLTALEGETIAYDSGAAWVDDGLGTGPRGFAVVANVTALAYPGSDHPRRLGGAATGDVLVRFAADAATYVVVVLARGP